MEHSLKIRDFDKSTKDWSVSNKTYKNLKKEPVGIDSNDKVIIGKKKTVICPICKKIFNLNNLNRIPDHSKHSRSNSLINGICDGAFSKLKSDKTSVENINYVQIGNFKIGDKVILDCTKNRLKDFTDFDGLLETKITNIIRTDFLLNNNESFAYQIFIKFEDIENPINQFNLRNFIVKNN